MSKTIILKVEVPDDDTAKLDGVLFTDGEFRINRYAEIIQRPTDEDVDSICIEYTSQLDGDDDKTEFAEAVDFGVVRLRSQIWGDEE